MPRNWAWSVCWTNTRDGMTTQAMIDAIRALPAQGKPSDAGADGLLDGLDCVNARAHILMAAAQRQAAAE